MFRKISYFLRKSTVTELFFLLLFFLLKNGSITGALVWILLNFLEHFFLQTTIRQLLLLIALLEIINMYLINPCQTQVYLNVNKNLGDSSNLWFSVFIFPHRFTWVNSFSSMLSELFCFDSCTSSKQQCSKAP